MTTTPGREEFEKWWEEYWHTSPRPEVLIPEKAFQAGRRSRQKQDAELCRQTVPTTGKWVRPANGSECAIRIEETP